ncbi:IPT/TIG domain-containing protein [Streptomyces sp. BK022]|uniref:IPT/TIG domain-containing protein n=1 Tax=Streptomyces sp. BK022 TaxID=2512123 RepID=UPI001028BC01|nr:IPT/TIG domain-containing protein [Streptomyces sp. BK022]RZU28325.1 IPT/TIG domain-containing protein [Streptomyces sp. BK022]
MGLYTAAGTRIAKAAFPASAAPITDPEVVVTADVYGTRHSDEGSYYTGDTNDRAPEGDIKTLAFRAGQVVRQSQIDRMYSPAVIASISPATGPVAGGTVVTITGKYLDGVSDVKFNGASGTALKIVSPTKLTVTAPAGTAGARDVVLVDDAGNVTKTGGFTYS